MRRIFPHSRYDRIALQWFCLFFGLTVNLVAGIQWQEGYETYLPNVTNQTVYTGQSHDSSIIFFDGKWLAMWDSGTELYGQVIWQSTSTDLVHWSAPIKAFSSSDGSENPVEISTITKQWQPALLVVGNTLFCLWSTSGEGFYFSTLEAGNSKWSNRMLFLHVKFSGQPWGVFVGNGGIQTSDGKIIFPITLMKAGGTSIFDDIQKRDSVIYTEDNGMTWKVPFGSSFGPGETQCWEATVWEPEPNLLNLISRNNRKTTNGEYTPQENLKFTQTTLNDMDSWTNQKTIPLEAAMSRPYVTRHGGRNILIQNDWHALSLPDKSRLVGRKNLTMFFNRGKGYDFVAGLNVVPENNVEKYPIVDYPQMAIQANKGVIIYSTRNSYTEDLSTWKVKVAIIDPLPSDSKRYIFPRTARGNIEQVTTDGKTCVRLKDNYSSAGVEIDDNSASRDKVAVAFSFKPETSHRQTILSFGSPAVKVYADNGRAKLGIADSTTEVDCGPISGWTSVELESGMGKTNLKMNNSSVSSCSVDYAPGEGRTMYLGLNYYAGATPTSGASFLVDSHSIKTAVQEGIPPSFPIMSWSSYGQDITLTWTDSVDSGSGLEGYEVDVSSVADFGSFVPGWQNKDLGLSKSVILDGLVGGKTYYAQVRAYDSAGNRSENSNTVVLPVMGLANPGFEKFAAEGIPGWQRTGPKETITRILGEYHSGSGGLKITAQPGAWQMAWQDWKGYSPGTAYQLTFWGKVDSAEGLRGRVPVLTIPPSGASGLIFAFVDVTEPEWTKYSMTFSTPTASDGIRLRCYESTNTLNGTLYFDDFTISTVTTPVGLPGVPRAVSATAGVRSLAVSWEAPEGSVVDSYKVFVSTKSSFSPCIPGWSNRDVGNMTSAQVNGLEDSTTYYVRVRAYNRMGGTSVYTATLIVQTLDTIFPGISVTAPVTGTIYTTPQTVPITANATDNVAVSKVWFKLGGVVVSTDTTTPYEYSWPITGANNGAHTWSATAFDALGNSSTTVGVPVTVNIDITNPTVAMTAPVAGTTYTTPQTVAITATASDNVAVTKVWFKLGGVVVSTDTTAPYEYSWAITGANNGAHTWSATAFDAMGNSSTTVGVPVTVNIDVTNPVIAMTAPVSGTIYTTPQSVAITANATDNVAVTKVWFKLGGVVVSTDTTAPYAYIWAITGANNGAHTWSATAFDAMGNTSTSAGVPVTVNIDIAPPTVPSALSAPEVTATSLRLAWAPSTDNVGVAGYHLQRGTATISTLDGTGTSFIDSGLAPSTKYQYTVSAFDGSGNESVASEVLEVTTQHPPLVPPTGSVTEVTATSVGVRWTAIPGATRYTVAAGLSPEIGSIAIQQESVGSDGGITDLTPNTAYSLFMNACDETHCSDYGYWREVVTLAAVPSVSVKTVRGREVELTVNPQGNPAGTVYRIEMHGEGETFIPAYTGVSLTPVIEDLKPGERYDFRVMAQNHGGLWTAGSANITASVSPETVENARAYPSPFRPGHGRPGDHV
jgi:chitodextrinase